MNTRNTRNFLFIGLAVMLLVCGRSHGSILLDGFGTTQVLSDSQGTAVGPDIVGGERDTTAGAMLDINSAIPGQAQMINPSNPNPDAWRSVVFTYDGVDGSVSTSSLNGLGDLDLTQGGVNDRFRLNVTSASHVAGTLTISVNSILAQNLVVPLPAAPGIWDLPFADFRGVPFGGTNAVNFADVGIIRFHFRIFPGESYTIDSIAAVPEPSTGVLLLAGAGIFGLFARRLRRAGVE